MRILVRKTGSLFKQWIRHACYLLAISTGLNRVLGRSFIALYHGGHGDTGLLRNLEKQLLNLKPGYEIVSLQQLLARLQAPVPGAKVPIVLNFDDGLRNNLVNVVPLLLKHEIPAIFFICPGLVESGVWIWNLEARIRLQSLSPAELQWFLKNNGIPGSTVEDAIAWLKDQPMAHRRQLETRIRAATESFLPSETQRQQFKLMNWPEIHALPELVSIGSHSAHHHIKTRLEADELLAEVAGSQQLIEAQLPRTCDYFCYPNASYAAHVLEVVRRYYKAAVTAAEGYLKPGGDPYLQPGTGIPLFAWQLLRLSRRELQ